MKKDEHDSLTMCDVCMPSIAFNHKRNFQLVCASISDDCGAVELQRHKHALRSAPDWRKPDQVVLRIAIPFAITVSLFTSTAW